MAKDDVIELEGTVVEGAAERYVSGRAAERP